MSASTARPPRVAKAMLAIMFAAGATYFVWRSKSARKRAAHHEAAHAVLAAAYGLDYHSFTLDETFLNASGTILGFTGWHAPLQPANPVMAGAKVCVFLAGQRAEKHLERIDPLVRVPQHDPNWADDDNHAAAELGGPALRGDAEAAERLSENTDVLVQRYWRAITFVARELMKPMPPMQAAPVSGPPPGAGPFVADSRIIPGVEVRSQVVENLIAEKALERWRQRGCPMNGGTLDDWLFAEKEIARQVPGILERWIGEANRGAALWLARLEYQSVVEAQTAITIFGLIPNTTARVHGSQTTVLVEFPPAQCDSVATQGRRPGATFLR